jgi:hypothetical protein
MNVSVVVQPKNKCKGVSLNISCTPAMSQKVQLGEWFLTKVCYSIVITQGVVMQFKEEGPSTIVKNIVIPTRI